MDEIRNAFASYLQKPGVEGMLRLLKSCESPLYSLSWQILRKKEEAELSAQETMTALVNSIPEIRDPGRGREWLYRTALQTAIGVRKKGRRATADAGKSAVWEPTESSDDVREAVGRGVAQLPGDLLTVVVEHFIQKKSLEKVAEDDGETAVAVWKRVLRAKEVLKETLQKERMAFAVPFVDAVLDKAAPASPERNLVTEGIAQLVRESFRLDPARAQNSGGEIVSSKQFFVSMAVMGVVALALGWFLRGGGGPVPPEEKGGESAEMQSLRARMDTLSRELAKAQAEVADLRREREKRIVTPPPGVPAVSRPETARPVRPEAPAQAGEANHRAAAERLRELVAANEEFRAKDRDGDEQENYWVRDVAGLYALPGKDGKPIHRIPVEVARADQRGASNYPDVGGMAPCGGYWFVAIPSHADPVPTPYDNGTGRHSERFGFCALPARYGVDGTWSFIVSEKNVHYRKDTAGQQVSLFPSDPEAEGWVPLQP